MNVRLSRVHFPVTVLGHGARIGVWFQGCRIHCEGCVSRDTWDPDGGIEADVHALLAWCRDHVGDKADGVTITGGEPFDQPEALGVLLEGLEQWRTRTGRALDVLCYSGYPMRVLRANHGDVLARLDAVVAEPFVAAHPSSEPLAGSGNQSVIALSELGHMRYDGRVRDSTAQRVQVSVQNGTVWMIGIPQRGDLEALERKCLADGVALGAVSWRA